MSKAIWKFPLHINAEQVIEMPAFSKVLAVQTQRDDAVMWALVDPSAVLESRKFVVAGTGNPLADEAERWDYIGTFQLGWFVWHVFEVKP